MTSKLTNRIAVITGAGAGIGRAIALRLASLGVRVYVNDIVAESAEAVAAEIKDLGSSAIAVQGDMGDESDVDHLFSTVQVAEGRLDILVTQAGVVSLPEYFHTPDDLDGQTWDKLRQDDETLAFGTYLRPDDYDFMLRNDLHSTFYCCLAAVPLMRAAGGGRIITMTAAGGGISSHFSPPYGVAKGGVVGLTRSLARQLLDDNIIVNCISQGFIDAGVWKRVETQYPEIWERDWEVTNENGQRVVRTRPANRLPMKRLGRPEEVAGLAAFLASDDGAYFVGQTFNLSGGVLIP